MSNIINKVKDTLTGHSTSDDPHHTSTTTSTTHHNPTSTTTAGPHSSNIANKVDPRVDSDLDGSRNMGARRTDNYGSTTAGPHSSNLANKADPRVDSDRDGSRNMGAHGTTHTGGLTGGHTGGLTGGHNTHGTGTTGAFGSSHTGGSTTAGPHSSNLANKADPRVDSDLDGSRNMGAHSTTHTGGLTGGHNTHGTGTTGAFGSSHTGGSTTAGPHSSNLANKADPRVDSDLDGSRNMGARDTHTGAYGSTHTAGSHAAPLTNSGSTTHPTSHGTHQPVISSGPGVHGAGTHSTHGTSTTTSGHHGTSATGPAPNTAGPHKSDIMNKMDPRVDSDLDGSKTIGGDKTHAGTTGTTGHY